MMFGAQVWRASSLAVATGTPLLSGSVLTEKMPELFADLVSYASSLNQYFALSLEVIIIHYSISLDIVLLFYDYSSSRSFGKCRGI